MTIEQRKRDVALVVDDSPETLRLLTDALDGAGAPRDVEVRRRERDALHAAPEHLLKLRWEQMAGREQRRQRLRLQLPGSAAHPRSERPVRG